MTLALASSPPLTSGLGNTFITNQFSPPSDSLLVALLMCFDSTDRAPTNSGTSLTWTLRKDNPSGSARIYTAPNAAAQTNITVTAEFSSGQGALRVYVITGHDAVTPVGADGSGTSTTNNATVNGYVSTRDGSRGIAAAVDSNGLGVPSSSDDEDGWNNSVGLCGMAVIKAANTSGLATVTFNLDAFGASTPAWDWAAIEVLPALGASRPLHVQRVAGQAVHRATLI